MGDKATFNPTCRSFGVVHVALKSPTFLTADALVVTIIIFATHDLAPPFAPFASFLLTFEGEGYSNHWTTYRRMRDRRVALHSWRNRGSLSKNLMGRGES